MSAELKIDDPRISLNYSGNLHCSCIYKITDLDTGKVYIGRALDLLKRYNHHKHKLYRNKHYNIILQRLFNKNRNLKMEVIEEVESSNLCERELYHIHELNTLNRNYGYNLSNKSNGGKMGTPINVYNKIGELVDTLDKMQDAVGRYATNRVSVSKICSKAKYYKFTKQGYTFSYRNNNE